MRHPYLLAILAIAAFGAGLSAQAARKSGEPAPVPAGGVRVYVSDETGTEVVIVDPDAGKVLDKIKVGKRPRGIKVSHDGTQLFVALSGSPIGGPNVDESKLPPADRAADGIGVVDLKTHKLVRNLKSGDDPETFDISPDGKTLYVSNEDAGEMSTLDLTSGKIIGRLKVGEEPEGVTVRPGGREVYVTSEGGNAVAIVNPAAQKVVATLTMAARPRGIVFTKDGATAFVSNEVGGAVTVVDAETHKVSGQIKFPSAPPPGTPRPMGLALSLDGRELFVSLGRAGSIAVIDVASRKITRTIAGVGTRPWGIALSPDGKKVYTANGPSGDMSVVDLATGKVDRKISTGGSPWGVAVASVKYKTGLLLGGGVFDDCGFVVVIRPGDRARTGRAVSGRAGARRAVRALHGSRP
jgi:YVTN family beta-propeller protein